MKSLIAALAIAASCLAAEVRYSPAGTKAQNGLLVLPLKQPNNNDSSSTTPRSVVSGTENLEEVNAKIFDKLKQEQGEYHVYLQDGRLQKVQYITAPITSGQQAQQQQYTSNNNYNQQQQAPEILSPELAEKRGVYFVQVPEERIPAFQNYARQTSQFQSSPPQYRQAEVNDVPVVRYLAVPL